MNSTARVSAAVAVSGGIAAAVAIPQAASASPVPAVAVKAAAGPSLDAQASVSLAQYAAQNGTLVDVSKLLSAGPNATPLLESVSARSFTQPAATQQAATQTQTASYTSRSSQRPVVAQADNNASSNSTSNGSSTSSSTSSVASVSLSAGAANSAAVAIAERYLGVPYVTGGSSPSGFDCSGLTSYVYRQLGISIPRTAAAQQAALTPVSNPQPGDLVFFGYPAYHVGIYAGNGMMIAAPYPGQVVRLQKIWDTPSGYGRP